MEYFTENSRSCSGVLLHMLLNDRNNLNPEISVFFRNQVLTLDFIIHSTTDFQLEIYKRVNQDEDLNMKMEVLDFDVSMKGEDFFGKRAGRV